MGNRYEQVFIKVFGLDDNEPVTGLEYQGIKQWDSVGHMALVASIEAEFGIQLEVDDVIDFSSYSEGKTILSKYGVEL